MTTLDLFAGSPRISMHEAMELTAASLIAHAINHPHWVIAWSGGKDSTATLITILKLIDAGIVPRPLTLTVLYADTRQELPPLAAAAEAIMGYVRRRFGNWVRVERAMAPMDKRFLVYILGRGVRRRRTTTRCAGAPGRSRSIRWLRRSSWRSTGSTARL